MKTTGGRDTFLLFIVLLLALGAVCYLMVIQKNMNKLKSTNTELEMVRAEKAEKDAIIQQAQELDAIAEDLKNQSQEIEKKLLPDIYTSAVQRKLYKHFEDANLPYYVTLAAGPVEYTYITMPDGTASRNRVFDAKYTVSVSGTDGFLLTHEEGDGMPYAIYTDQLIIGNDPNTPNPASVSYDGSQSAFTYKTSEYTGYAEFVEALKKIQAECPDYVKITDIKIEDTLQGFCNYSAVVNVYAFDLIDRISKPNYDMNYMKWVGADNIAKGGLVGMPGYFNWLTGNYNVPVTSPLYGKYASLGDYDFSVNRPFAAWTNWSFNWILAGPILENADKMNPVILDLTMRFTLGMITPEEYDALLQAYSETLPGAAQSAS